MPLGCRQSEKVRARRCERLPRSLTFSRQLFPHDRIIGTVLDDEVKHDEEADALL